MEAPEASGSIANASPSEVIVSLHGNEHFQGQRGDFPSTCEKVGCAGIVCDEGRKTGNEKLGGGEKERKFGSRAKKILSLEKGRKKKLLHPSCPNEKAFN